MCSFLAEGAGVEPARLLARRVSTALPSPIGWPFRMESHAGFAPTAVCFADIRLTARPVRHVGGCAGIEPASPGSQSGVLTAGRTSPRKLRRKGSNLRTPISKTGVCTSTNYSASNGAAARTQTSNRAFRRGLRCSLAPRRRVVHLAGLEPAHAPGLSRLPLPIGLQMHWSGRRALLPPPPAWRAGALLNELLPGL